MKRIFFLTGLFFVLFIASSQAQIRLGVKAGANFSDVSGDNITSSTVTGFQGGIMLEWLMIGNFGFDAAAVYSQRGVKIDNLSDISNIDKNMSYLDIPVNLKLMLGLTKNIKPFATAGPYISFNLSGDNVSDQWKAKTFGAGLNFGVGLQLFRHFQLAGNYGLSLTDDFESTSVASLANDFIVKNRTWSATLAYLF